MTHSVVRDPVETRLILSRPAGQDQEQDDSLALVLREDSTVRQILLTAAHPQRDRQFAIKVRTV